MEPIISIVGRPNVGKSTLFNRLIGYRKAITEDIPGVTRDRNYGEFEYRQKRFILIDTGGFEPSADTGIFSMVKKQIEISMEESSALIFILDGKDGILPQDHEIADLVRRYERPVFYVINKMESSKSDALSAEFYALGIGKFYPVSALHGIGILDLLDDIYKGLYGKPGTDREEESEYPGNGFEEAEAGEMIKVAIVGRPNTGKSSIANRLLGAERMIVSDVPGTTRDAIDSKISLGRNNILLIDTAGLRRKSRIEEKVEGYSVSSAIRTIDRAHVVNLVIDAQEGVSHQDAAIAHLIIGRGKGICLIVNKWDLVHETARQNDYKQMVRAYIPHAQFAPLLFVSAKTGRNIGQILKTDLKIRDQLARRIQTADLNRAFEEFTRRHTLSWQKGRHAKILYVHQAKAFPPTFIFFASHPKLIPENYKRYLENSLREVFGFAGAPLRLIFRKKD